MGPVRKIKLSFTGFRSVPCCLVNIPFYVIRQNRRQQFDSLAVEGSRRLSGGVVFFSVLIVFSCILLLA